MPIRRSTVVLPEPKRSEERQEFPVSATKRQRMKHFLMRIAPADVPGALTPSPSARIPRPYSALPRPIDLHAEAGFGWQRDGAIGAEDEFFLGQFSPRRSWQSWGGDISMKAQEVT